MNIEEFYKFIDDNTCLLNEKNIHDLNNMPGQGGEVNNVIRLISEQCFGILGYENYYSLYYITNNPELKGLLINIPTDNNNHNEITLGFAKLVNMEFPDNNLNILDVANVFQQHKRTYYSKFGDNIVFDSIDTSKRYGNGTVVFLHKPIDIIHFDKLSFYQAIFNEVDINKARDDKTKSNKIYILYNVRNNLFKIGRSIKANYREKTLQGEEPHIDMLACWIAPKEIEKELHNRYKDKRFRGEWFSLDLNHLEEINVFMEKYR